MHDFPPFAVQKINNSNVTARERVGKRKDTDTVIRLMHVAGENGRTLARYILEALEDEHGATDTSERLREELHKHDRRALERRGIYPGAS